MSDYGDYDEQDLGPTDYDDGNWCPACHEPRGVCTCEWEASPLNYDNDWDDYDPNVCPECGSDTTAYGDWIYCTDTNECGWSEYIGDDVEDGKPEAG